MFDRFMCDFVYHQEDRAKCPLFFIFETGAEARDFIFRGLAVPGSDFKEPGEDLVAVWRTSSGERFQNYRATIPEIPLVALQ